MNPPKQTQPTVRVTAETHALAQRLAIDLTAGAGRRLSMTEILAAAVVMASEDREGLLSRLTAKANDSSGPPEGPAS